MTRKNCYGEGVYEAECWDGKKYAHRVFAHCYDDKLKKQVKKSWGVVLHGYDEAYKKATAWREDKLKELYG